MHLSLAWFCWHCQGVNEIFRLAHGQTFKTDFLFATFNDTQIASLEECGRNSVFIDTSQSLESSDELDDIWNIVTCETRNPIENDFSRWWTIAIGLPVNSVKETVVFSSFKSVQNVTLGGPWSKRSLLEVYGLAIEYKRYLMYVNSCDQLNLR